MSARTVTRRTIVALGLLSFLFGCRSDNPYHAKDGVWYWKDVQMSVPETTTLTPVNDNFAIADGRAYYHNTEIAGSDAGTFQALDHAHAKDATHVWFCDTWRNSQEYWLVSRPRATVIEGADPASYTLLTQRYSRDRARIYHEGKAFPVRDAATFEVLYSSYARDQVSGYYMQEPVADSDGPSFEGLSDHFARDKAHVWYSHINIDGPGPGVVENLPIAGADPATFTAIEGDYGKDGRRVYLKTAVVAGADPQTFTPPR